MKRFFNLCGRYHRSLSLLASGVLPEPEKEQVEIHLAACADCRKYYEEIRAVAVPLANWAQDISHLQPRPDVQIRWTKAVEAAGRREPVRRLTLAMAFCEWWRGVIWPHRRVWAGLAAVWVMILAGNLSLPGPVRTLAGNSSPQEMVTAFKDQQKILAELMAGHSDPSEAEPQKFFSPKPRTEGAMVLTT